MLLQDTKRSNRSDVFTCLCAQAFRTTKMAEATSRCGLGNASIGAYMCFRSTIFCISPVASLPAIKQLRVHTYKIKTKDQDQRDLNKCESE